MDASGAQEGHAGGSFRSQAQYYLGHLTQYPGRDPRNGEPMSQEEAVRKLLVLGQVAVNAKDYESAIEAYESILQLEPNETACYNLGSFCARGLGTRQDYVEAARLFHQAELLGNAKAGKLCGKCMFDYVHEGLDAKTPADLYAALAVFVSRVYPEADDQKAEVDNALLAIAATLLSRGEQAGAEKAFRAAAEYCGDERAQHYLDLLAGADGDADEGAATEGA